MKICENGKMRKLTPEEIAEMNAQAEQAEREYWLNTPYKVAVNYEIRKRYDESDEFAILRQKDEKPEEYAEYFAYCEQCKAYVKDKQKEVTT
jgi:hypothetical protein